MHDTLLPLKILEANLHIDGNGTVSISSPGRLSLTLLQELEESKVWKYPGIQNGYKIGAKSARSIGAKWVQSANKIAFVHPNNNFDIEPGILTQNVA